MNTLLKQELITRIKNNLCFICGKILLEEKVKINHFEIGEAFVCIKHLKEKVK